MMRFAKISIYCVLCTGLIGVVVMLFGKGNCEMINFDKSLIRRVSQGVPKELSGLGRTYVAVFQSGKKTLVYIAEQHSAFAAFDAVNKVFANKDIAADALVVEYEYTGIKNGQKMRNLAKLQTNIDKYNESKSTPQLPDQLNTLEYSAALAYDKKLNVYLADMDDEKMCEGLHAKYPDQEFTSDDLDEILHTNPYDNPVNETLSYIRDEFMLDTMATALNENDTVVVHMGRGHFTCQYDVLVAALGAPELYSGEDVENIVIRKNNNKFRSGTNRIKKTVLKLFGGMDKQND